jgi:hypothetical protein
VLCVAWALTGVGGCRRRSCCRIRYVYCVYVCIVQVALMSEVARARTALDAHIGAADVAEAWLHFLRNLAHEKANRVRC